jgi:hypothetical protein
MQKNLNVVIYPNFTVFPQLCNFPQNYMWDPHLKFSSGVAYKPPPPPCAHARFLTL